nr:hypothetical protein BaRGS_031775 [Batillaria attramentaria]
MVLEDGEEKFRMDEREVRRHALLVMDGLGLAIDCLQDPDKLHRFLRLVGVRHYRAGVTPDMLEGKNSNVRADDADTLSRTEEKSVNVIGDIPDLE